MAESGDQFLNTLGSVRQVKSIKKTQETGFGASGLAHMQGAVVPLREAGRDAALHRERLAQTGRGVVNAMQLQALANRLGSKTTL